jgi:hypothetical protein
MAIIQLKIVHFSAFLFIHMFLEKTDSFSLLLLCHSNKDQHNRGSTRDSFLPFLVNHDDKFIFDLIQNYNLQFCDAIHPLKWLEENRQYIIMGRQGRDDFFSSAREGLCIEAKSCKYRIFSLNTQDFPEAGKRFSALKMSNSDSPHVFTSRGVISRKNFWKFCHVGSLKIRNCLIFALIHPPHSLNQDKEAFLCFENARNRFLA